MQSSVYVAVSLDGLMRAKARICRCSGGSRDTRLRLEASRSFESGLVQLEYALETGQK